ncbi:MAG: hypothetical protein WC907_02610 [Acholeplasmataceae bacterium]
MRKIIFSLLSLALMIYGISHVKIAHANEELVTVYLTSVLDDENILGPHELNVNYKTVVDISDFDNPNYDFSFWIVNGVVRYDLNSESQFLAYDNLNLTAVYENRLDENHPVIFMDTNGELIGDIVYVENTKSATPPTLDKEYSKPGYQLLLDNELPTWSHKAGSKDLDNITEATVYSLTYELKDSVLPISINNDEYAYNSLVTLTANNPNFTHWEENGTIVSFNPTYTFTALYDRNIEEKTSGSKETMVTLSNRLDLRIDEGYESYLGHYELKDDEIFIEAGLIFSEDLNNDLNLSNADLKLQSNSFQTYTSEFLRTIPRDNFTVVKAYLITDKGTYYSEDVILDIPPIVKGVLHHWMPDAIGADATYEIKLGTAPDLNELIVRYDGNDLEEWYDYEIDGDTLILYGEYLVEAINLIGEYEFDIISENGISHFTLSVVDDPRGTSIPTKFVTGTPSMNLTEPIPDAPDLLITEMSADMGHNSIPLWEYIEVFNNTTEPYDLFSHRIVYAAPSAQTLLSTHGLFDLPLNDRAAAAYIYQQDYIIDPLSSAMIWVVNRFPWTIGATPVDGARRVSEQDNMKDQVFGPKTEDNYFLTLERFRNFWNLDDDYKVFPVRLQYILHNNGSAYNPEYGLGQAVARATTWSGINTAMKDRGIQIQKINQDIFFPLEGDDKVPVGSKYFKYEWLVTNKEEDVYVDGVLQHDKIKAYGTSGASLRETINGLAIRKVYYNSNKEKLGYVSEATGSNKQIDMYGDTGSRLRDLVYKRTVSPIATALFYPNLIDNSTIERYGYRISMEYTIPEANSTLMRFIPRHNYSYSGIDGWNDDFRLSGVLSNNLRDDVMEIEVPINPAYPVSYIVEGADTNTVGNTIWYNFYTSNPQN